MSATNGTMIAEDKEAIKEAQKIAEQIAEFELEQQQSICKFIIDIIIKKAKEKQEQLESEVRKNAHHITSMEKLKAS